MIAFSSKLFRNTGEPDVLDILALLCLENALYGDSVGPDPDNPKAIDILFLLFCVLDVVGIGFEGDVDIDEVLLNVLGFNISTKDFLLWPGPVAFPFESLIALKEGRMPSIRLC